MICISNISVRKYNFQQISINSFYKKVTLNTSAPNHYNMDISFTVPSDHTAKIVMFFLNILVLFSSANV